MSPSLVASTGHSGRQTPQATQSSVIFRDTTNHHLPFLVIFRVNGMSLIVYSILTHLEIKDKIFLWPITLFYRQAPPALPRPRLIGLRKNRKPALTLLHRADERLRRLFERAHEAGRPY